MSDIPFRSVVVKGHTEVPEETTKILAVFIQSVCQSSGNIPFSFPLVTVFRKIIDKWQMQFKENNDFDALIAMWGPVIESVIAFNAYLTSALDDGLKNKETADKAIKDVKNFVSAIRQSLAIQWQLFLEGIFI